MKPATERNPHSLPPVGIDRAQAAVYIGVDVELFDRLVAERRMPEPRTIHGRLMWDAEEVAQAFRRLPHRAPRADVVETKAVAEPAEESPDFARVYTPRTLAERWGCSAQHVRNMVDRGELPAFRLGGQLLRIRGEDVEAFECRGGDFQNTRGSAPAASLVTSE